MLIGNGFPNLLYKGILKAVAYLHIKTNLTLESLSDFSLGNQYYINIRFRSVDSYPACCPLVRTADSHFD